MQMLVPRYLEQSIDTLTREQEKFRTQMTQAFGGGAFGPLEEQVRRNMELFQQTFSMFKPFTAPRRTDAPATATPADDGAKSSDDMDTLRRQMKEMQEKLDRMAKETDKS
jgi:polyhydroxyalkanoate synthesis regulator protein